MSGRLADRFKASQGAPIEVDGRVAQMAYDLPPIAASTELRVQMEARSSWPQGLRLRAQEGDVLLNDQALSDVVLWSDTAPPEVVADLRPKSQGKPLSVRVWNVWRDDQGTMQAWIGDAGLVVDDKRDGSVTLCCSDGFGKPDFGDLAVKLTLARS